MNRSTLLYGSETWLLKNNKKLKTAEKYGLENERERN